MDKNDADGIKPECCDEYVSLTLSYQNTLHAMFDSMKNFVGDVNLKFAKYDVEISSLDPTGTVVVVLLVSCEGVYRSYGSYVYKTSAPRVEVCVDARLLSTILKSEVKQADTVEFKILTSEPGFMNVIERDTDTRKCTISRIKTKKAMVTPNLDYAKNFAIGSKSCIILDSEEFHDIIEKLYGTGSDFLNIWCDKKTFTVSAEGHSVNMKSSLIMENMFSEESHAIEKYQRATMHNQYAPLVVHVYTVDPLESKYLEKRSDVAKWGIAMFCTNMMEHMRIDVKFPMECIRNISKSKSINKAVTIIVKDLETIAFSYDTLIGSLLFLVTNKKE